MPVETAGVPDWLNQNFLQSSLRKGLKNDQLILKSCDISRAAGVGDHYASQMFRVRSVLQKRDKSEEERFSFVVKSLPLVEAIEKVGQFFTKEARMFTKTLPTLHELLIKAYPEHKKIHAECYYVQGPPNDLLILEDLQPTGFVLGDRYNGLDLDHTLLVIESLAKMHASSLVALELDPKEAEAYDETRFSPQFKDMIGPMFKTGVKCVAEVILNLSDLPGRERYYKKLNDLEDKIIDKFFEIGQRDDEELNVLLHGDCWTGNMMFSYEDGKPKAVKLVDYQISNYNSPTEELIYFIFTSSRCRFTHVEFLLKTYHRIFTETLNRLNYQLKKPFTVDVLKKDFNKRLFLGFSFLLCCLPVMSCPPSHAPDINKLLNMSQGDTQINMYNHAPFISVLRAALPFFEERDVF